MPVSNDLLTKVEVLQNLLINRATGRSGDEDDDEYKALRRELTEHVDSRDEIPRFVKTCRDLFQFWRFIQPMFPTYQERREFLWTEFGPVLDKLESATHRPLDEAATQVLDRYDSSHVHEAWQRALERRSDDPEGAITAARTLLETVCKHILEDSDTPYDEGTHLPGLYRLTAETLNLAPSQHQQDVFKRILGGCTSVVENLGALRNRLGDAHGKGRRPARPSPRHAELAVNLAGSMAAFLVATYEERGKGSS